MDGMPINDKNTPTTLPQNEFTQMIELIHARNQGAPVSLPANVGVPISGTPLPTARSADLGRPVALPPAERPLTASEIEELNQQALRSGLVVGPVNPSIERTMNTVDAEAAYGTLEDAIRAGAPISADENDIAEGSIRFREPTPNAPVIQVRAPIGGRRVTPREVVEVREEALLPKMPDFKKVQMIDLVNGKCYVDGVSFDLLPAEVKTLRKFCVTKARDTIQSLLDAALAEDDSGEGTSTV